MVGSTTSSVPYIQINPAFLALSRFRRRRYEECVEICSGILTENPYDKAIWLLKCQALTAMTYIDDSDLEEQGIADTVMDENATSKTPRPGTSLQRPTTGKWNQVTRPVTNSGRPNSGFLRPSTRNGFRPGTNDGRSALESAMRKTGSHRPGLSRPVTSLGRHVRLGTASMRSEKDGPFIDSQRLDLRKYAQRPALARALCDYLLYHDHDPRKTLELASEATTLCEFEDWWWKSRLGKCYYILGMFRDAEQQFKSSLRLHSCIDTFLDLGKVYLRIDQPRNALDTYAEALESFPGSTAVNIAVARTHDMLQNSEAALQTFKDVLKLDPSNIEAVASLGAHYFYSDQPEVALRFYKRLLELTQFSNHEDEGLNACAELWNNVGLCCFFSGQYDMTLRCFENALAASDDSTMADVWYNIGQVGIAIGDLGLAYQCFKIAISIDPAHGEAYNNLGVLEVRKGNQLDAASNFSQAKSTYQFTYEPRFNQALLAYKQGNFNLSYKCVQEALQLFPDHPESNELLSNLISHLH